MLTDFFFLFQPKQLVHFKSKELIERRHVTANNHAPSSRFFLYRF